MFLSAIALASALQVVPRTIPRSPPVAQRTAPLSFGNGMRVDCATGRMERAAKGAPSKDFRQLGDAPDAIGQRAVLRLVDGCPTAVLIVREPVQP